MQMEGTSIATRIKSDCLCYRSC